MPCCFTHGEEGVPWAEQGRKRRALKIKSCDHSVQKRGGRGRAFPRIAQLPDLGSSFWRAPGGCEFATFCVSAAHGTLPSMTSSSSVPYAEPTGMAGAGDRAALGLFQFTKMHCCCLDEGGKEGPGRGGNPLHSASSCSCSCHPWQQSPACLQQVVD